MAKKKSTTAKPTVSTQQYLDIVEIKNDAVILKDGTLRAIVLVSSINFALKSEDEQNAVIQAYVAFLNSLEHSLQIVIQSRRLDIESYINNLKQKAKEQTNDLLKMQTQEYIQYISELVEIGEIMTKSFYVVIPYSPLSDKKKNFFRRLTEAFTPAAKITLKEKKFIRHRKSLMQRVEHIKMGLTAMGLAAATLDTQGLIELFYNVYNPVISSQQKLTDLSKLRVEE